MNSLPDETNAKTIWQFEDIYCGADFEIDDRLAFVITMVYVAFIYGPGMPIMFIIVLVGLIALYVNERLSMAYSYKKPPMYDNRVIQFTLKLLQFSPVLYFISAAWLFSN